MRIVYVYENLVHLGGIERIFTDKMNYLAEKLNHEIYLITTSQGNHPFSFPLSKRVRHIDLNIRFHTRYQYKLPKRLWIYRKMTQDFKKTIHQRIQEIDPDILIATTYWNADVICRIPHRCKKVIESHCAKSHTNSIDDIKINFIKQILNKRYLKRRNRVIEEKSDAVIALTQGDAKEWGRAKHVYVIPNTTSMQPKESPLSTNRVISLGRLTYQKGYDRLIAAWEIVNKQFPEWKLDLFGEGDEKENLLKQIHQARLENSVTIHPPSQQVEQELVKSSIFALSSNYEGFGLVLIEAMSCGVPCVSFDFPYGASEIIDHEKNGLLIENGNIPELANALCRLIKNEDLRKEYGKNALRKSQKYSNEEIMPQWDTLLQKIAKKQE